MIPISWTAPPTYTVGQVLTAANLNTYLRDNLNYFKGSAAALVSTSETTTSTTYTDLATVGPSVTVVTDVQAFVSVYSAFSANLANENGFMGFAVTGGQAAADSAAVAMAEPAGGGAYRLGNTFLVTGLTPGSNTFTAKYRTNNQGAGYFATFSDRRLMVEPA